MRRQGVTGLPEEGVLVDSIDVGEDGETIDVVDQHGPGPDARNEPLELVRRLSDGQPVLELELPDGGRIGAVEETAVVQTWPRLDPDLQVHVEIKAEIQGRLQGGEDALMAAHASAHARLEADRKRHRRNIHDHPNMGVGAREEIDRKLLKVDMRMFFEPLDGEGLQKLLGLTSLNAADRRNTNYRAARERLFPRLYAEFQAMEAGS